MNPSEIKVYRKTKKMTQTELGKLCGVNTSSVSAWEKGTRNPSGSALIQLERLIKGEVVIVPLSDIELKLLSENVERGKFKNREDYLTASLKHLIQFESFGPNGHTIEDFETAEPENIHYLPFLGAAAAGEPVEAPLNDNLQTPKSYPPDHFIVEVNGGSAESDFPDGSRWVIDGRNCYTPKHGKPCIVSDEYGSYLKKWNRQKKVFESINPEFKDVIPGEAAKLRGYPVEMIVE